MSVNQTINESITKLSFLRQEPMCGYGKIADIILAEVIDGLRTCVLKTGIPSGLFTSPGDDPQHLLPFTD